MDTKTLRMVIAMLGAITLATVVGGMILAFHGTDIPAALIGIGSSSGTAIVALLTRPPTDSLGVAARLAQITQPSPDFASLRDALTKVGQQLDALATPATPPPA